uniref:Uncharacterized protein n=1 Tax=Chromera velia CCMP2878 TaxID=1169474 RepID=A0A0G4HDV3_9ALVE|eukprot:Cvel_6481.t1-p1 / transcript=Cvel_6481.t1 / gene=Cvel_6481 / organism=Chromera_velia_CCMP2878 / gene_product=hypothetical protein / transcript_product=hypothetical protein / location=Cvel_scaffold318:18146-18493(-) / protein_length=116 / sequence_SO=supercontig / SO=protein_coding / is_pseudo=false
MEIVTADLVHCLKSKGFSAVCDWSRENESLVTATRDIQTNCFLLDESRFYFQLTLRGGALSVKRVDVEDHLMNFFCRGGCAHIEAARHSSKAEKAVKIWRERLARGEIGIPLPKRR